MIRRYARFPALLTAIILAGCVSKPQGKMNIGHSTLNVARTALEGGSPQMAINVTNAVLKSDPHNVEALVDRGDAYYEMDNCRQALIDYHQALAYSPHAAGAQLGIGRCLMRQSPQEAVSAFTKATKDNPQDADAFNDLGVAQDEVGNIAAANAAFERALAIDPSMEAAKVNLGFSLAIGGEPERGQEILAPLAEAPDATPKIRQDYAAALALSGHEEQARNVLQTDMSPAQADKMISQFRLMASQIAASRAASSSPPPSPPATSSAAAPTVAPVAAAVAPPVAADAATPVAAPQKDTSKK